MTSKRFLEYGGILAGIVLIVFGVVAIGMGANGRSTVRDSLKSEQIFFGEFCVGCSSHCSAAAFCDQASRLENPSLAIRAEE